MSIISETTKVKIGKRNSKHYKELGYQFNLGDEIEVKVKDLTHGSEAKIEILCDMCKKTKMIVKYYTYNQVQFYQYHKGNRVVHLKSLNLLS